MPTPSGHLGRALHGLTLGATQASRSRERLDREMGATEIDLQFHVAVSGNAGTVLSTALVTLEFEVEFYYAPGNRDSDLQNPLMTFGAEADEPVALTATVTEWVTDPSSGAVNGAVVAVGVIGGYAFPFKGFVHINIQGWGMVSTSESASTPT